MARVPPNLRNYQLPKSICICGHTGDGPLSSHLDGFINKGHGACAAKGCNCLKFSWKEFTQKFQELVDAERSKNERSDC